MEEILDGPQINRPKKYLIRLGPLVYLSLIFLVGMTRDGSIQGLFDNVHLLLSPVVIGLGFFVFFKAHQHFQISSLIIGALFLPGLIILTDNPSYFYLIFGEKSTPVTYAPGFMYVFLYLLCNIDLIFEKIGSAYRAGKSDPIVNRKAQVDRFKEKFQNKSDAQLERIVQNTDMSKEAIEAAAEALEGRSNKMTSDRLN